MQDLNERYEVRRFMRRLALFAVPFIVLLGVPLFIFERSGELMPTKEVIAKQERSRPVLYGVAYSDVTPYYKLQSVLARKPKVIALGASTVMQFSSRSFTEPDAFFNAGGAIGKLGDFEAFMSFVPHDAQPDIVIVGMPQFYFKSASASPLDDRSLTTDIAPEDKFFDKWSSVWKDLAAGKISLPALLAPEGQTEDIGLQAVMRGNGFLNDGSYSWGSYVSEERAGALARNQTERHSAELAVFKTGASEYAHGGEEPDARTIAQLDAFLADMHARHVYIIGFLPPSFTHVMYALLREPSYDAGYLFALESRLRPVFAKYGYPVFDYSDIQSLGSSDAEFYDSNHATRKAYARMLVDMARRDPVLAQEVNAPLLVSRLHSATSTLDIF